MIVIALAVICFIILGYGITMYLREMYFDFRFPLKVVLVATLVVGGTYAITCAIAYVTHLIKDFWLRILEMCQHISSFPWPDLDKNTSQDYMIGFIVTTIVLAGLSFAFPARSTSNGSSAG